MYLVLPKHETCFVQRFWSIDVNWTDPANSSGRSTLSTAAEAKQEVKVCRGAAHTMTKVVKATITMAAHDLTFFLVFRHTQTLWKVLAFSIVITIEGLDLRSTVVAIGLTKGHVIHMNLMRIPVRLIL